MASWVIGDVHGCWRTLERLLQRIELDEGSDRLWLVGDLVNRGPGSLEVLRWARDVQGRMGSRFVAVLGNHDLHLLALAAEVREPRPRDTLEPVFDASDGEDLVAWLAARPLVHREGTDLLVHAGLLPAWTPEEACRRARRVEEGLRSPATRRRLLSGAAAADDHDLDGARRDLAVLSGVRTLTAGLELVEFAGPLSDLPAGCRPWFDFPGRAAAGTRILFGHWAALGFHRTADAVALDTGASWGGALTAFRLEDGAVRSQPLIDTIPTR